MRATSAMTREVILAVPELPLTRAWEMMKEHRIRHLPVMQGGHLIGILSDRDILLRARQVKDGTIIVGEGVVGEAMTPEPITCTRGTTVSTMAELMLEKKIDALPVMDTGGHLVGLVTSADLLALLVEPNEARPLPYDFKLRQLKKSGEIEPNA